MDILALWLHRQLFVAMFALGWQTDPVVANIFIAPPLSEIALVLVRFYHVAGFIANANHRLLQT
jgi:hypothetical protein